jgi:predicted NBD/HSP70 family sugar kinase
MVSMSLAFRLCQGEDGSAIACQGEKARSAKGIRMNPLSAVPALVVAMTSPVLVVMLGAASANADTPVGACTNSYSPYTYEQLAFDPDAQAIFSVIDTNGDGVICFKFYPNGDHNGHLGNLVDDKAAPHA